MSTVVAMGAWRRRGTGRAAAVRRGRAARHGNGAPSHALTEAACAALLAVEVLGSALMWAPIPLAWFWIGRQVGAVTGSLTAAGSVAFFGFTLTVVAAMAGLARLDRVWVSARRRAGHDQREGALNRVVIVSATFGLAGFFLWYYVLSGGAYVIPFMPYR